MSDVDWDAVAAAAARGAAAGYEILDEGEVPGAPGHTYRLRRRRSSPDEYQRRVREQVDGDARRYRPSSRPLIPEPEPFGDGPLRWTATRLDQPPKEGPRA